MSRRSAILAVAVAVAVAVPLWVGAQGGQAPAEAPKINTDAIRRDSAGNVIFNRESFSYPSSGRRDPFSSLIESGDIRPMLADLQVVAITISTNERLSVATLKDKSTDELYRVRVGSVFGRIRVTAIRQREVQVAVDEFGNTRQEILPINVPVGGGRTP